MTFYRRERSTSSTSDPDHGEVASPPPVYGGSSQFECAAPSYTCLPDLPYELPTCRCEPIPTGSPAASCFRSIHPVSPWSFLVSLLLDLAIFCLLQALHFTAGASLLHALYPTEVDYTMSTARSMRIGAAGGAMFVGIVTLRSLLQLACCDPEEDAAEEWTSVWDAVGCLPAKRTPDVRYVAFIGVAGSAAFGRGTYDMSGVLHAATAALVGYVVLSVAKGALSYVRHHEFGW